MGCGGDMAADRDQWRALFHRMVAIPSVAEGAHLPFVARSLLLTGQSHFPSSFFFHRVLQLPFCYLTSDQAVTS
jgi:hypothetical protein